MNITRTPDGGALVFELEGRLDTTTAPELQAVLIPAFGESKAITLDFSGIVYVSSAGLRVLLMAEKEAGAPASGAMASAKAAVNNNERNVLRGLLISFFILHISFSPIILFYCSIILLPRLIEQELCNIQAVNAVFAQS